MRAGDALLLLIVAASLALIVVDGASGGAVQAWVQANLSTFGTAAGRFLVRAGLVLSPLLLIPLIAGLWGRLGALPAVFQPLLARLARVIDAVNETIADAVRWFALALVLITVTVVIQRYVFGNASTKLQESVIYFHALLFLLSSASTLLHGGHVRVDILYTRMSEAGKAWTDLLGYYLALLPMSVLILMTSRSYVGGAWRILERSRESDGLPLIFLLKTAIPLFAVMMILQGLSMAARAALTLSGKAAPARGEPAEQEL